MSILRKLLCKMGSHPNVRFLTHNYLQCQDCRRIQRFAIKDKWDDKSPWINEPDWLALHRGPNAKHD